MEIFRVLFSYATWHYSTAIKEGFIIWKNFVWFLYHFFSIPLLLKTFFSRFQRMGESYQKGLAIGQNFSTFIVNTLMRIVGMGVRSIVIIFGLAIVVAVSVLGVVLLALWLVLPFALLLAVIIGISKIL